MKEIYKSIKSLVGLFIPVKFNGKWSCTFTIGRIPLFIIDGIMFLIR